MAQISGNRAYSLEEAVKAQKRLRDAAGLAAELFPVEAFVGMISDQIEALRAQGRTEEDIAKMIGQNSAIRISAREIVENYATREQRHSAAH